jgi:transcriptional regulator with XRE-family HTH domain
MATFITWPLPMSFPVQLIQLRKQRALTQQQLADAVGIHVNQIKRYEAGTTQPTLEVLIKFTKALHISLDTLVFGDVPELDDRLRRQLEAIKELEGNDKIIIQEVLEGLIFKYQAKRWTRISSTN